jgi:hypothetical protein
VDGDAVSMKFLRGDNTGETFAFRWTLDGTALIFRRDASIGIGPTPFLVSTWTKTGGPEPIPFAGGGPTLLPSTYRTSLDPQLTFTVGHEVDLDCASAYVCRGDVDADLSWWTELEFGNRSGSVLTVISFHDPFVPTNGMPTKTASKFASWVAAQPGVIVTDGPSNEQVGNRPGVQVDVDTGTGSLNFGATPFPDPPGLGIGPGGKARLDAVEVGSGLALVIRWLGPENELNNFEQAADALQPIVDSMVWGRGSMTTARLDPYAVVLADGRVLVGGGFGGGGRSLTSSEMYSP